MIAANEAKVITDRRMEDAIQRAKTEVRDNSSSGWEVLLECIVEAPGPEIEFHETKIRELFSDNIYWTTNRVHSTLMVLGYKVKFSHSSNPANERWFISWGK